MKYRLEQREQSIAFCRRGSIPLWVCARACECNTPSMHTQTDVLNTQANTIFGVAHISVVNQPFAQDTADVQTWGALLKSVSVFFLFYLSLLVCISV